MDSFDTIAAPATPPGEGSVSILRLSGPDSITILNRIFRSKAASASEMRSHQLYHGHLYNVQNQILDEFLAVVMRQPHSYTGENVVELHCHGGSQMLRNVLDLLLDVGARMARPGEFTQRAFLNGRLDLAQAEAVIALIRARSEKASRVALEQLDGSLSRAIYRFADQLKEGLTYLEAHIDFPDDEVGEIDLENLLSSIRKTQTEIAQLVESFDVGRILRDGINILILGRPNVGKSSLMNALLGESRAIVTEIPGTTRDTLEEPLVMAGFPVRLIDAAGVRETNDPVEQEGVRRAREKATAADLVLLVLDASENLAIEDSLAMELCQPDKTLLVLNKSDQAQILEPSQVRHFAHQVSVSAKYGFGLEDLKRSVVQRLEGGHNLGDHEGVVVTERRHRDALQKGGRSLERFVESAVSVAPLELLAMDLREALSALGEITGETTPDEILHDIFSRFCIGK
jgi:tRNA modification GTPase